MTSKSYLIGLMSGTSVDGVDCALVSFTGDVPSLEATYSHKFDPQLRQNIFRLCEQKESSLSLLGETDVAIGQCFADAVNLLLNQEKLKPEEIKAIGSHGQTVYHKPHSPYPFTLQLGDPNIIALNTKITTVADFRRKDMAAGGQGAPLAPLFHHHCFSSEIENRVIVNLGGIANITILARGRNHIGYDTGPANVLMDYWIHKNRQFHFDNLGKWASEGEVSVELLEQLLDDPYFSSPEPKSTGREYFNGEWLESNLLLLSKSPNTTDVQATLLELTATTVATEIENQLDADRIYLCGGGAHNVALVNRLIELLPNSTIGTTSELGIAPDWVEAVTFAWLAKQRLDAHPVNSCSVTGASQPVTLGGVYLPA